MPLDMITWPRSLRSIHLTGSAGNTVVISQWHLPLDLDELKLSYLTVTTLPKIWPVGLGSFICYIGDRTSDSDLNISKVWPNISQDIFYMPNSTVCLSMVSHAGPTTVKHVIIHPDPITSRPTLKLIDPTIEGRG